MHLPCHLFIKQDIKHTDKSGMDTFEQREIIRETISCGNYISTFISSLILDFIVFSLSIVISDPLSVLQELQEQTKRETKNGNGQNVLDELLPF